VFFFFWVFFGGLGCFWGGWGVFFRLSLRMMFSLSPLLKPFSAMFHQLPMFFQMLILLPFFQSRFHPASLFKVHFLWVPIKFEIYQWILCSLGTLRSSPLRRDIFLLLIRCLFFPDMESCSTIPVLCVWRSYRSLGKCVFCTRGVFFPNQFTLRPGSLLERAPPG